MYRITHTHEKEKKKNKHVKIRCGSCDDGTKMSTNTEDAVERVEQDKRVEQDEQDKRVEQVDLRDVSFPDFILDESLMSPTWIDCRVDIPYDHLREYVREIHLMPSAEGKIALVHVFDEYGVHFSYPATENTAVVPFVSSSEHTTTTAHPTKMRIAVSFVHEFVDTLPRVYRVSGFINDGSDSLFDYAVKKETYASIDVQGAEPLQEEYRRRLRNRQWNVIFSALSETPRPCHHVVCEKRIEMKLLPWKKEQRVPWIKVLVGTGMRD